MWTPLAFISGLHFVTFMLGCEWLLQVSFLFWVYIYIYIYIYPGGFRPDRRARSFSAKPMRTWIKSEHMRCLCGGFEATLKRKSAYTMPLQRVWTESDICNACAAESCQNAADLKRKSAYAMPVQRIFAWVASARVPQGRYGSKGAVFVGACKTHTFSWKVIVFYPDGSTLCSKTCLVGPPYVIFQSLYIYNVILQMVE